MTPPLSIRKAAHPMTWKDFAVESAESKTGKKSSWRFAPAASSASRTGPIFSPETAAYHLFTSRKSGYPFWIQFVGSLAPVELELHDVAVAPSQESEIRPNLLEVRLLSSKFRLFVWPKHSGAAGVQAAVFLTATGATFFIRAGTPTRARACAWTVTDEIPSTRENMPGAGFESVMSIVFGSGKVGVQVLRSETLSLA